MNWNSRNTEKKETGEQQGKSGKKKHSDQKTNRNILGMTYLVVLLFVGMLGYFGYFLQIKSEQIINNSYNSRLDSFSDRVVRGQILSNDGTILAQTMIAEDGQEIRNYPYGPLFSHVVGYSSKTKGKTGIEALGNFYMLTSHVNLLEQTVNELSDKKNLGDHLYTTLDLELQKIAYDALGDRRGAVVVMKPDTGQILAMVSKPDYDPNTLETNWESLVSEENDQAQLLNRATQGLYPPGSTFKIVTLLEYMREYPENYRDFTFDCDGHYEAGEYDIRCYHETAHGHQDLDLGFANSCNGVFASLGQELDLNRLKHTTQSLLFEKELPLTLPYKKSRYTMEEGAELWEILQTSIGQGNTQLTPMHNAMIMSAIANGGILMTPYLMEHVENAGGETIKKFMPESYGSLMSAQEAGVLTEFLTGVVTTGTGSAVRTDAYTVAGKTGSAEFEAGKESHAWFVGFAPVENPQLVVSVLVEEGGSGGKAAAPVARSIFDAYFSR